MNLPPCVTIHPNALVHPDTELKGEITIAADNIIEEGVKIIAESGAILLGEGNRLEKGVSIINKLPGISGSWGTAQALRIGSHNIFCEGSTIETLRIGDGNIFEAGCYIGTGVNVGKNCRVNEGCKLTKPEDLLDNSHVFRANYVHSDLPQEPAIYSKLIIPDGNP